MSSNFFAMVNRMKLIDRWALMNNSTKENIAEHSHSVAVIAHALALIGNKKFGKSYNAERAALLALYHDTTEVITGDMPTPVKYYNDDIKNHRWASKPQIRKYDKVYNGKLRIVFGARSYIRDNDSEKLEDRLGDILVTLYEKAEVKRQNVRELKKRDAEKKIDKERNKKFVL